MTIFLSEVKHDFQRSGSKLRGLVRERNVANGDTLTFQKLGPGTANTKARHADVTPMDLAHDTVSLTLEDYYAPEYIDKLDQAKTSVALRREYSKAIAMALGRKVDEIITDAWAGSTNIVAAGGALSLTVVENVYETLRMADVEEEDLFWAITPAQYTQLINLPEYEQREYSRQGPRDNPVTNFRWMGFHWHVTTGLPLSGANRLTYAGSKTITGFGIGNDIQIEANYIAEKVSTLVNGMLSMGAVIIDDTALIEITCTD
jgi:hypothetical protein